MTYLLEWLSDLSTYQMEKKCRIQSSDLLFSTLEGNWILYLTKVMLGNNRWWGDVYQALGDAIIAKAVFSLQMEKQRLRGFKQMPRMSQFQSSRWNAQGQVQPANMNHEGDLGREAVRSSADTGLHDYVALWSCWWGRPLHHPFLHWSPHSFLPACTWNSLGESCIRNHSPKKHRVCPPR